MAGAALILEEGLPGAGDPADMGEKSVGEAGDSQGGRRGGPRVEAGSEDGRCGVRASWGITRLCDSSSGGPLGGEGLCRLKDRGPGGGTLLQMRM